MGKERRHALHSQIRRLLTHLLKYQFQPSSCPYTFEQITSEDFLPGDSRDRARQ
jgi:hypothetical protein